MTEAIEPTLLVLLTGFLASAIRVASPLLIAALGEMVGERAGVINLGLEGAMLSGALAAVLGSQWGPWTGVAISVLAGTCLMLIFAAVSIWFGADQIITGTALTLAALGLTGAVSARAHAGGTTLSVDTFPPVSLPLLGRIPLLGPTVFQQSILVYLTFLLVPVVAYLMYRTQWGLRLRACGESPQAAQAAGVRVRGVRTAAILISGACGGLAGGTLVLAQVGTFAERMTAGRGFVAIAIVILGRWHPLGVMIAALTFGGLSALQFFFQALDLKVPYQLFLMLPYILTLFALAGTGKTSAAPAALGR
jgi:simple sugar transport system permease protein